MINTSMMMFDNSQFSMINSGNPEQDNREKELKRQRRIKRF